MIRVLLADDQPLVRMGLRALLDSEEGMEVIGEAGRGDHAVEMADALRPHVVLMDIRMPGLDGIEATRRITGDQRLDRVRVALLTTFENDDYVFKGLRAGAVGFLVKDIEPPKLLEAVRVVAAGEALLAPTVTRRLIEEYVNRSGDPVSFPALERLTDREREVLVLVARGLSNHEIADYVHCSPATAKTHVSRVMTKLEARDRIQLVITAYEAGLVRPGWKVT
ncbi:response regulator [Streptosporangium saharense]|uniref:DNA-binding NarL/FixJ family response regulator n=1 Tax=Streptosporangium saharense TaxID=1706840 RepID=A0A7W7VQD4_9ACTN|nr:response regulator transcription factor [Streptosporangium saharense]MBB4918886.1 DNA-binding NarL/FixJ family response regulator [Streptosporangium saharense]